MRHQNIVGLFSLVVMMGLLGNALMESSKKCHGSNSRFSLGRKGRKIIKDSEGLRLTSYQDSAGVWTIGWGHTGDVRPGQTITRAQAEQFLSQDVASSERAVRSNVKAKLNQDQFDALVSWTFNLGVGNLRSSTMLRKLNACIYRKVPCEIIRWDKATVKKNGEKKVKDEKIVLPGLVIRRRKEGELFNGGSFSCK